MKPYSLEKVKELLKADYYKINNNAELTAYDDFNWGPTEIVKCLLRLKESHYYKTEQHNRFPNTIMDYYKAEEIMEGFSIYTHFYIRPSDRILVISSFKEF